LVGVKLAILALFCALRLAHLDVRHFVPFEPLQWGVVAGASSIVFAFGGAARVAVMAEEVYDARHNVPRAILRSLLVSTAIYLIVGVAAIGLIGAPRLAASGAPLSAAIEAAGHPLAVYAISAGGLVGDGQRAAHVDSRHFPNDVRDGQARRFAASSYRARPTSFCASAGDLGQRSHHGSPGCRERFSDAA
jgi:hypothetical protein